MARRPEASHRAWQACVEGNSDAWSVMHYAWSDDGAMSSLQHLEERPVEGAVRFTLGCTVPRPSAAAYSEQLSRKDSAAEQSLQARGRMQPYLTTHCVGLDAGLELFLEFQDNVQRLQEELKEAAHLGEHLQRELDQAESERQQAQHKMETMQAVVQQAEVSGLDVCIRSPLRC